MGFVCLHKPVRVCNDKGLRRKGNFCDNTYIRSFKDGSQFTETHELLNRTYIHTNLTTVLYFDIPGRCIYPLPRIPSRDPTIYPGLLSRYTKLRLLCEVKSNGGYSFFNREPLSNYEPLFTLFSLFSVNVFFFRLAAIYSCTIGFLFVCDQTMNVSP